MDTVEVVQADRDAAAEMWVDANGILNAGGEVTQWQAEWMKDGTADYGPVVQAFARHRIAHSAPAWQTIDSAPRDGTEVLLCVTYSLGNGEYETKRWIDWQRGPYVWREYRKRVDIPLPPTHWMPLPPPPGEA